MSSEQWNEGVAAVCEHFQVDLSCLVDGELDEPAAARAMLHLESCADCREFFDEVRRCVSAHKDVADPDRLVVRLAALTGSLAGVLSGPRGGELDGERARSIELVSRLSSIFYQLGKAYVLAALPLDQRTRVFEEAVAVEPTQVEGRGFVDGVLEADEEAPDGVDWHGARGLFNGRLERIQSPLEKGRKLLQEALEADPSHEEARIYLAFLNATEGRTLQAAAEYRNLMRSALDERNRGHAAVQLGCLHEAEGDFKKALACFRWVKRSGLASRDERFYFVDFNIAVQYARMGKRDRSLAAFRELCQRNAARLREIAAHFAKSRKLQAAIEAQPGFPEQLLASCPALFGLPAAGGADESHDHPSLHEDI